MNYSDAGIGPDAIMPHPNLAAIATGMGFDFEKMTAAIPTVHGQQYDRNRAKAVVLDDGKVTVVWEVPSLRQLYRGQRVPPSFAGEPPEDYLLLFRFVEEHALRFCDLFKDRTDGEFEEAYSNLRRRPDGKPLSDLHDYLWRVSVALLGLFALSEAEYEGILGRLAQSARTFQTGVVSRNYVATLRMGLD